MFGFTVFNEVPRHSPLFLLIEVGALGCMAAGLWMLIQYEEAHQLEEAEPEPVRDRSGLAVLLLATLLLAVLPTLLLGALAHLAQEVLVVLGVGGREPSRTVVLGVGGVVLPAGVTAVGKAGPLGRQGRPATSHSTAPTSKSSRTTRIHHVFCRLRTSDSSVVITSNRQNTQSAKSRNPSTPSKNSIATPVVRR